MNESFLRVCYQLSPLKVFKSVDGSNLFQVIVFTSNQQTTQAANRLYLCDICKQDYGSYAFFKL